MVEEDLEDTPEVPNVSLEVEKEAEKIDDNDGEKEGEEDQDEIIPSSIEKPLGGDILEALAVHKGRAAPGIPLCRCLLNTRVRKLRTDLTTLKRAFDKENYVWTKGLFILSTTLPDGSSQDVTVEIKSKWDKHWITVNDEFEKEIEGDETWSFLSNKMFYVWEGNHRTASWMESIKEIWSNNKQCHIRVHAQFISPQPKDELKLIAALQRFNL